jgi:hypothetical protein
MEWILGYIISHEHRISRLPLGRKLSLWLAMLLVLTFSVRLESHLEGKKHILKKQNPNFVYGKKKKTWFVKILVLKNHFLEMKLKTSFSKCAFNKKHG